MVRARIDDEQVALIDAIRGDVPRDAWIRRAISDKLELLDLQQRAAKPGAASTARPKTPGTKRGAPTPRRTDDKGYTLPKIAPRQ